MGVWVAAVLCRMTVGGSLMHDNGGRVAMLLPRVSVGVWVATVLCRTTVGRGRHGCASLNF